MKLNPLVLFGLAGALGLVAFLATQHHLAAKTEEPKVAVLVARTEIQVGDPVTEANCALKEIFVSGLPPRPITKPEQWQGKFAGSRFTAGEVIVQDKVAAKFGSDSRKIPQGMLVQTINVDRAKSHAGLLTPGDRVDVFGSFDISESDERTGRLRNYQMIKRVLGDLEVWSVGSTVVGAEQGGDREGQKDTARRATSTIGLLTMPEQYAKLAGAEAAGKLFLGLRHPDDDSDPGEISFVSKELYENPADQQRRAAEAEAEAEAEHGDARGDAGGLGAFLDQEIAAASAPVASAPSDVPTWTVTMHVGGQSRLSEVVDVAAARAAGFTPAQIADKRRQLQNPGSPAPTAPFEPRYAARTDAAPAPAAPFEPPVPASDDAPAADVTLNPSPRSADARDAGMQDDGLYPAPE